MQALFTRAPFVFSLLMVRSFCSLPRVFCVLRFFISSTGVPFQSFFSATGDLFFLLPSPHVLPRRLLSCELPWFSFFLAICFLCLDGAFLPPGADSFGDNVFLLVLAFSPALPPFSGACLHLVDACFWHRVFFLNPRARWSALMFRFLSRRRRLFFLLPKVRSRPLPPSFFRVTIPTRPTLSLSRTLRFSCACGGTSRFFSFCLRSLSGFGAPRPGGGVGRRPPTRPVFLFSQSCLHEPRAGSDPVRSEASGPLLRGFFPSPLLGSVRRSFVFLLCCFSGQLKLTFAPFSLRECPLAAGGPQFGALFSDVLRRS